MYISLENPLFPIKAMRFFVGCHAGLKIPLIGNRFILLLLSSRLIKIIASDFPDLTATAIFSPSGAHAIPGFKICSSSNSNVLSPLIIFLINFPSSAFIRYKFIIPSLSEKIAINFPFGEIEGAIL